MSYVPINFDAVNPELNVNGYPFNKSFVSASLTSTSISAYYNVF